MPGISGLFRRLQEDLGALGLAQMHRAGDGEGGQSAILTHPGDHLDDTAGLAQGHALIRPPHRRQSRANGG